MIRVLTFLLIGWLVVGCQGHDENWHAKVVKGLLPDLMFSLNDENGNAVTEQNYLGDIVVLFFGYTHCPDVCPMTLGKLRLALKDLPETLTKQLRILFVSIDPQRDTAQQLRNYTDSFGPNFIGLTGSDEELLTVTKRYRTTFSYGDVDEQGNYPVSHSSAAFIFDRTGEARLLVREESADDIRQDLLNLFKQQD